MSGSTSRRYQRLRLRPDIIKIDAKGTQEHPIPFRLRIPNGGAGYPQSDPRFRQMVRDHERAIRDRPIEYLVVYDTAGKPIATNTGEKASVSVPYAAMGRMAGAVLTHNHPSGTDRQGDSSFSPQDVRLALSTGLAEVRAVGPNSVHSLRPGAGQVWNEALWHSKVEPAMRRAEDRVYPMLVKAVRNTPQSFEAMRHMYYHMVWTQVARETGMRYKRTFWSDRGYAPLARRTEARIAASNKTRASQRTALARRRASRAKHS